MPVLMLVLVINIRYTILVPTDNPTYILPVEADTDLTAPASGVLQLTVFRLYRLAAVAIGKLEEGAVHGKQHADTNHYAE
jgi:hypothetical protein